MRTILYLLFTFSGLLCFSQETYKTGDADLDKDLGEINLSANTDFSAFRADLSATFGVTSKNLDYMVSIHMEPAEMYLALEIAAAINQPVEVVVDAYEKNRDKGWGYIAQELGIKPGSAEFHALKEKTKTKKEKAVKNNASNGNSSSNGNPSNSKTNNSSKSKKK